ncbi:MAG: tetratricopeptide repeat protein [Cytophagaceae bacterium]
MKSLLSQFVVILSLIVTNTFAQTNQERAFQIGEQGIALLDKGEIEEAIEMFQQAAVLDPENIMYPYETAYGHYLTRHYKKAIHILEKLVEHKDVNEKVFQLLGNSYDNIGNYKKAIEAYQKGLELHPNSGDIYMELGTVEMHKKNFNKALEYFEKGIEVEPDYPTNYYWASKISCSTSDVVWGIMYGEIYINLLPGSERAGEISRMLFDVYKKNIDPEKDTVHIVFANVSPDEVSFEKHFEDVINESLPKQLRSDLTLADVVKIRSAFVEHWIKNAYNHRYPNVMFDHHKSIYYSGHLEAYNYWLFSGGDSDDFFEWKKKNEKKLDSFLKWREINAPVLTTDNFFVKKHYHR